MIWQSLLHVAIALAACDIVLKGRVTITALRAILWLLQAGISCADRVVTVSPGYAWEIQTPEGGWGMEGMLTSRSYALNGVLNGVDLVEWDPENDPHIYQNYGETSFTEGKRANKAGLQKEMGLPQRPEVLACLLAFELQASKLATGCNVSASVKAAS